MATRLRRYAAPPTAPASRCEQALHGFVDQHIAVATDGRGPVPEHDLALTVGEHDAGGHCVEAGREPGDLVLGSVAPRPFKIEIALEAIRVATEEPAHESSGRSPGAGMLKLPVTSTPGRSGLR